MDEEFKAYAGIDVRPTHRLDDNANFIKIEPDKPVQPLVSNEQKSNTDTETEFKIVQDAADVRSATQKVIEGHEVIVNKILELVERKLYMDAYSKHCDSGVSVARNPEFLDLLQEVISDALHDEYAGSRNLYLLYLLDSGFDVDSIHGLREFIELVIVTYCEDRKQLDNRETLEKFDELFGHQINFDTLFSSK